MITANGLFMFSLQASFALGFAVLGPLSCTDRGRTEALILIVAVLYLVAATPVLDAATMPRPGGDRGAPRRRRPGRDGAPGRRSTSSARAWSYIRHHSNIFWSLTYFTITASLIGVLGVLGTAFAKTSLGLPRRLRDHRAAAWGRAGGRDPDAQPVRQAT